MPDPCEGIHTEIADLEGERADVQRRLQTATSSEKPGLVAEIRRLNTIIQEREASLRACVEGGGLGVIPGVIIGGSIPGLQHFGWEINQGLRGYNLIAGKDTLLRIFVGTPIDPRDPTGPPPNVTPFPAEGMGTTSIATLRIATLELVILHVGRPDGVTFDIPGEMSGVFTNTTRSFSERDNVNFYVPGRLLSADGPYFFSATFYRSGGVIASFGLGGEYFLPSKDIRLLVLVENYAMTAAAWSGVEQALLRVSRNLPIRSGVGPMDGDLSNGLRYRIDPTPQQFRFRGPILDPEPVLQVFNDFNASQRAAGRPDVADRVLTVRTLQSNADAGVGNAQGIIASVVYRPATAPFNALVCQELGHVFGASIMAPPSSHSPNGTINDPSAFDLLGHRSVPNPRPFMYNPLLLPDDDSVFFEPLDWNAVRGQILLL